MAHSPWWEADEGQVHSRVFEYVAEVERTQSNLFDRFQKLAALYDPLDAHDLGGNGMQSLVSENVVASNIDTVTAVIAATDVRARFMTDDGDWSTQRRARHLEWYAEGLSKQLEVHAACRSSFKAGALKGTGLVKVYVDDFNQIRVEHTMVDDIVVDQGEVRAGAKPRQMHQRMIVGCDELVSGFPDFEDEIRRANKSGRGDTRLWADYRPIDRDELVVIESWRLPVGTKGSKGYLPGKHSIVIDGTDLLVEDWHKDHFPFAVFRWSEKTTGWYGIGLAERIAGHQRALNKLNWQIDRQLDQFAVPTTYVRMADANLAVKSVNRAGTIVPIKGDMPQTVVPQAVSAETYRRQETIKASSFEESGVSRMAAQSMKPGGLDSGAALREYRDATTQRFAQQEKAYEQLYLDVILLCLGAAKDLGKKAPTVIRKSKHGPHAIEWGDVDLGEVRVQIAAASDVSKTPAGRTQFVLELAQAGVITLDESRRLLMHPDTEHALSLYTAARECIEADIESMLDGNLEVPDPYSNLKLVVNLGQSHAQKAKQSGAPEEILENLRQYTVQAAWMVSQSEAPAPVAPAMPGMPPEAGAMPMDPAAGGMPPMQPGMDPTAMMTGAGVAPMQQF